MISVFDGHSIIPGLLPNRPTVLDVGCRGFAFGDAIRSLRPSAVIHELDIDLLETSRSYTRAGLAEAAGLASCSTEPDACWRHLIPGHDFPVYTIASYSACAGVASWDVIKLDCEGSEYGILQSFDRPWARQLTVEFHQHTHFRREWSEISAIIGRLSQWYTPVQHRLEDQMGLGMNYWDSLLIAR
jgi:hypothetical protein